MNRHIKKISTQKWRKKFLSRFNKIKDLQIVIDLSKNSSLPVGLPYKLITRDALSLIKQYPRIELCWAKSYYNTSHLIEYWRWYQNTVSQLNNPSKKNSLFNVYSIRHQENTYKITPIKASHVPGLCNKFITSHDLGILEKHFHSITQSPPILELARQILTLHHIVKSNFSELFQVYINTERLKKSEVWEQYRTFTILNTFLYINKTGAIATADFNKVFFNSNLRNLLVYLNHKQTTLQESSINDINNFLSRQRHYMNKLATTASLAETEIMNFRYDLSYYDDADGIVKTSFTEDMRKEFQELNVDAFKKVKLDGCPFARALGVRSTGLTEIYKHFDDILINYLNESTELPPSPALNNN